MAAQKESKDLLNELQMLQKVLGHDAAMSDDLADIPVLNDLFESSAGKVVQTKAAAALQEAAPVTSIAEKAPAEDTSNPLLDLIRRERLVDEMVEDIMPIIKQRLRLRIREMIKEESGK